MENSVSTSTVRNSIQKLGLSGRCLEVHASLRSFGWVDGGASTIVDALLAEGCTVLVPTFSWGFGVPPPPGWRLPRNAWDYDACPGPTDGIGKSFAPDSNAIDADMGAIPAAVLAMPARVRGYHPENSFTAVGPLARDLVAGQAPLDVYAPLKELARRDGAAVLMGVGLDKLTLLHLSERNAGRRLFRRWASGRDGRPLEMETGGCSDGFPNLEPHLAHLERRDVVGESTWRVFDAGAVLEAATRIIERDPAITHCSNADCPECNDAVAGGPVVD
ncbi:MAG TPA: AAC(3) family N-acetyltransferase [Chloroflexota bacterium]|nr:AAC(3) family N-acetyltransferase [Chloroflexota bacterium]